MQRGLPPRRPRVLRRLDSYACAHGRGGREEDADGQVGERRRRNEQRKYHIGQRSVEAARVDERPQRDAQQDVGRQQVDLDRLSSASATTTAALDASRKWIRSADTSRAHGRSIEVFAPTLSDWSWEERQVR